MYSFSRGYTTEWNKKLSSRNNEIRQTLLENEKSKLIHGKYHGQELLASVSDYDWSNKIMESICFSIVLSNEVLISFSRIN